MLIDTHAHLHQHYYGDDLHSILEELPTQGLSKVVNVAVNAKNGFELINLAEKYSYLVATAGCHPTETDKLVSDDWQIIKEQLTHHKVVAIGEVGLDYYWKEVDPAVQKRVFVKFLELSLETKSPIIIHNREADEDMLKILREVNSKYSGVFHCYAGSVEMARELMEMGFKFSFNGVITYPKSDRTQIITELPLESIMLETDSPYLTPVPWRGKQNSPAKIIKVAEKIAEIKNLELSEVAKVTTANAKKLFNLSLES